LPFSTLAAEQINKEELKQINIVMVFGFLRPKSMGNSD
jgi:hypothetical protein